MKDDTIIQDILDYLDTVLHPIVSPEHWNVYSELYDMISMLPSAERHGKWLMTDGYPHKVYCSECYATLIPNVEWFKTYNIASNYCPNCGAKMGEVSE